MNTVLTEPGHTVLDIRSTWELNTFQSYESCQPKRFYRVKQNPEQRGLETEEECP
jgi:hypothetical protein